MESPPIIHRLLSSAARALLPLAIRDVIRPYWQRNFIDEQQAARIKAIAKLGPAKRWASCQSEEVDFWESVLRIENTDPNLWPECRARRSDPNRPFQNYLRELIDVAAGAQIRVLDVGAGPLTSIGRKWPGRELHITAVDPLAAEYDDLLRKLDIDPPCRTTFALAEELSAIFTPSSFDLVHSRNAIDHSKDVLKAIEEMIRVVNPDAMYS